MTSAKALKGAQKTKKSMEKGMTASLEKNLAHAILDLCKAGDFVPQQIILMALKVTGDHYEVDKSADEGSISSRSELDRHGTSASDLSYVAG